MALICIVDVEKSEFSSLVGSSNSMLERLGISTGYRMEVHAPGEMPELFLGKSLPSLDLAKEAAERWQKTVPGATHWDAPTEAEQARVRGIVCVLRVPDTTAWELWHKDLFDLDTPAEVEVAGQGLAAGFTALWSRHLETGVHGLSRYTLKTLSPIRYTEISSPNREALLVLRRWVFPDGAPADSHLLAKVAAAHARLHLSSGTIEPLLQLLQTSPDVSDFVLGLSLIIEPEN